MPFTGSTRSCFRATIRNCFITRIVVADEESGERQGDKKRIKSLFFDTRSSRLILFLTENHGNRRRSHSRRRLPSPGSYHQVTHGFSWEFSKIIFRFASVSHLLFPPHIAVVACKQACGATLGNRGNSSRSKKPSILKVSPCGTAGCFLR